MGYTTTFEGHIEVTPPLNAAEVEYLTQFCNTRRMLCTQGPYYVSRAGFQGQDPGPGILDYNRPPDGQPGLWCHWQPTSDGTKIVWDGGEKFYDSPSWMSYIIRHFIGNKPLAADKFPFLTGHVCKGHITAQGEDHDDNWELTVANNTVTVC